MKLFNMTTFTRTLIACSFLMLASCTHDEETIRTQVDNTCRTRVVEVSPELRAWLKEQCTASGQCRPGVPADLTRFIKEIVENNEVIRAVCTQTGISTVKPK